MPSRLALIAVPILLLPLLAGCAPSTATPSPSATVGQAAPTPSASTSPTPTPTPTVSTPTAVAPATYLVGTDDWAFYTDATKQVWCEIDTEQGSPAEVGCWITSPAANAKVTFVAPASVKAECGSIGAYGAQMGGGAGLTHEVNWWGCYGFANVISPSIAAKTQIIPDNSVVSIAPFTVTVVGGVIKATESTSPGASLTFGLTAANFVQ